MSTPTERWKNWEGRTVDGKFPLRQWLGGSDHGAVFLTERSGGEPRKAAIKLIAADSREAAQLSRWAEAARLSHRHLIRLLDFGRCQIDDTPLLYVVMEYAEENLAEILPLRPLTPDEASAMLGPTAEALTYLHKSGFAHGRIKPSNIMAVHDQLKISADRLGKTGERGEGRAPSVYDAPEVATAGLSPAADIWSLGATLVAVLTQNEPTPKNLAREPIAVPETISQAICEIARRCLQIDPQQRYTASDILARLQPTVQARAVAPPAPVRAKAAETHSSPKPSTRWMVVPIVAAVLALAVWAGSKLMSQPPSVPAAAVAPAKAPPDTPPSQTPAPFAANPKPAQTGTTRGSVLQQVMPEVSQNAQNTIQGRLKVVVDVSVDASGNVSGAKFVSPGPSTYFASRALAAARGWKFNPPQVNGQSAPSEWVLRFQFRRTSIDVFPAEKRP